ncbi:MAG: hypothetical protein U9R38_06275, partial [Candidatus Margulisiibacteriota bacterium]|nr:hypothetical protein [Candidatus Margulisiibacteriota bacterium]
NFISVLVVKKESWSKVEGKEIFIGSDCNHMYIILSILFSGDHGVLKYIPDKIVKRRWGTDRIPDVEKRIRLDVGWIHKIAKKVFNNPKHVRGVDARLIKNDGFSWAVRTKISTGKSFYFNTFPFLFGYFWSYPLFWIKIVPLLFMPNFILKIMRGSYRKMIKGEPLSVQEVLDG